MPKGALSEVEQKIYDLVTKRFIAVFYPPAQFLNTTRTTVVEGYHFVSEGKVMQHPGWLEVYGRTSEDSGSELVPVTKGETPLAVKSDALGLATNHRLATPKRRC